MYIHGGGWVVCGFRDKKWSSLGCFLDVGWGSLFLRFLGEVVGRVAVVVVGWCSGMVEVSFVGCAVVVVVVGVTLSVVVVVCILLCSCGDICAVGIWFRSKKRW